MALLSSVALLCALSGAACQLVLVLAQAALPWSLSRFCFLRCCGCVFSERALKEIKAEVCHTVSSHHTPFVPPWRLREWLRHVSRCHFVPESFVKASNTSESPHLPRLFTVAGPDSHTLHTLATLPGPVLLQTGSLEGHVPSPPHVLCRSFLPVLITEYHVTP